MGLQTSKLRIEGYGRTKQEALWSLQSLLRYNYGEHISIHNTADKKFYYIWDGDKKHGIHFLQHNQHIKAFTYSL